MPTFNTCVNPGVSCKEHGTFSIASAEARTLHREFNLSRRNADEVSWNHFPAEEQAKFSKAIETEWQGVLDFKAVTIINSTQADVIREEHHERVISSRLVLRWKETDTGYKAKARWCVHGFKDPDIHEIERSCPTPDLSSINITLQILASTASEGVKSVPPTTENRLRKLYTYSKKNYKSTEDMHETNHINNKYNDTNMNTRKMHNT